MHVHQAGRSPGCRAGQPSLYTYLGGIYLPPSVVVAELVHRYMVVARSRRPVHGGGGNAHERATPLRYAYGSPIPWRTQWDPYQAVGRFPPFACAPSVPHVECAGVSALRFNPRGIVLNPVHIHAAAPLSISRKPRRPPRPQSQSPPLSSRRSRRRRRAARRPAASAPSLRDAAKWSVPSRRPIGARAGISGCEGGGYAYYGSTVSV